MTDEEHLREVIREREHTIKALHGNADAMERRIWDLETRVEAAKKREAALRKAIERVLTGREVYRGDHTEIESYDAGTIEDILRAALETKP